MRYCTIMPGSWEGQYIRLEGALSTVISAKNLIAPFWHIPSIYVSINVDSRRRWKSAISVLSSDKSAAWGEIMILSLQALPAFSVEIRASYEVDQMLGNGELVGKLEASWDELLDHVDEPFELSFPPVDGVHPSLTLKAVVVHACDNQDGHAQLAKYMTLKTVSHLNDAVEHYQSVLDQCPVDHPDRAAALTNLAWAHLVGYGRTDHEDIDTTTSLFREALALHPQGHPDHTISLFHLIFTLNLRHSKEQSAVYIQESTPLCCKLLPLCPEGTYLRSSFVDIAVNYLIAQCNNFPKDASNEGIHLLRMVLELCPLGHKYRPIALSNLALALKLRFHASGIIDDMDESVQLFREALSLCPEGHTGRGGCLNNLAFTLQYRFENQDKYDDLDEAMSLNEEALRLRPVGHESRDESLDNLGNALLTRFFKHHNINDINRAITLHREALTLNPPGHPSRDNTLNNLALALQKRYDKSHVSEDLDEAIEMYRESLRVRRPDHPERHRNLLNLSSAICSRFIQTQKNEEFEETIRLCQESLASLPSLHPDKSLSFMWLQVAYLARHKMQDNPADLSLAVENFRLGSRHPTQGLPDRIKQVYNWTVAAEQYGHGSALEAYSTHFELLDAHVATRLSTTSRREAQAAFKNARTLPVDAASCAIRRNDIRRAVELVEQGRGQQWSLASRLRTPLHDLEFTNPELAREFSELSKRLSDAQGSTGTIDRAVADRAEIQYRRITTQWEAVVAEIRDLQGFSRFLLPPSYKDLQAAACQGPVIILIGSKSSCSAIVVPTSGEPHHVRFPRITLTELEQLKDDFATAIRHTVRMPPTEPRKKLRRLLRIVWDEIMLPIVNVLQHDLKLQHGSRIWLCPTAAFTSIPLHAANPFRPKADRSGPESCLEDIFICSYTPTLSALIRSRQTMETCVTQTFAAIGQGEPGAGQGSVLPAVNSELKLVQKLIPPNVKFTKLSKGEATQAGALNILRHNTWVHLACHGTQDLEQPYNSRFAMRDKPLTLLDIIENNSPQAEFAFLSACHTAVGDEETPDEAIHLAAGLQFSGFKSVVGTLWGVNDALAKHVVKNFYENMFEGLEDEGVMDCTKAAWALNRATHDVMTKVPLEQRTVFIHIGV
ncbi:CHAT domain-containing protein [Suillus clintonianus]|uniref:CHAT domain-containing protein n=1 Tax=Suillus clintonianus TaxID=1904413 RepID=UPI001B85F8DD|nr:CHAT domain-containing protein [Suillus clintonianus]KAG2119195.1 CHAT domain-containing protein [Suillus clintonianus]